MSESTGKAVAGQQDRTGQPPLTGQVALITGASRGIGLAIAQRLVTDGAKVAITARGEQALQEAVTALGGPEHAIGFAGKADDLEHRAAAVAQTGAAFGPITILINNAGINPAYGSLMDLDLGAARKIIDVNLIGTLAWVQEVFRDPASQGNVVNLSSVSGLRPAPGISFYGISKAAIDHLTACLAAELGPRVRVNAIAPAVVKTQFAAALYEGREEQVSAAYPLRRLGEPEDVANMVAFLVSDQASWVTGQTFVLDGGVTNTGGVG